MKRPVILATALLLASTQFGVAETCREKFVRLLIAGTTIEPKNGAMHLTGEAEHKTVQAYKFENRYNYWIHEETKWMIKAVYDSKSKGYSSVTTQVMSPDPDMALPTPK